MRVLAFLFALLVALPLNANEIVGALSQNRVSLTANFTGSEILVYGAIRRDAAEVLAQGTVHEQSPFDVVVVIEGPRETAVVWRKARRAGIWVNVDSVTLASVPSYYAVATTNPLEQIITPETDAEHRISAQQTIRVAAGDDSVEDASIYTQALLRLRERSSAYLTLTRFVHVDRDILFRARVQLPASLTEGAYTTRLYLVRDGEVLNQFRTAIFVRKDGLERWLHQLAYDRPFIYGFLALAIALVAGWGASALFRLIRNG
ncbi:TIGR02186 family protein [Pararhodobacter oceanensis]|uniref:TIGR02186 family protein n=1 Tax=Pararhodobacter oceanensis TaxID=2172121 RepID=UPI003A91AEF7